jgi:hypothetical protein
MRVHSMAALEKYHFEECTSSSSSPKKKTPFACPAPDCSARFQFPNEYTTHGIQTGHDQMLHSELLPEPFGALFAANEQRLGCLRERHGRLQDSFRAWFGERGFRRRSVAEREFVEQLQRDPLYAQDDWPGEHPVLENVYMWMDADW